MACMLTFVRVILPKYPQSIVRKFRGTLLQDSSHALLLLPRASPSLRACTVHKEGHGRGGLACQQEQREGVGRDVAARAALAGSHGQSPHTMRSSRAVPAARILAAVEPGGLPDFLSTRMVVHHCSLGGMAETETGGKSPV
jgi:hypothetical protein